MIYLRLKFAVGIGNGIVSQDTVDGPQQWIMFTTASAMEIVQIKSPNHSACDTHCFHQLGFTSDDGHVVV